MGKSALVKWLVLGVMIWIQIHANEGCFEGERLALLQFKASLGSGKSDHLLLTWDDDDPTSDCCAWERVTCTSATGHVIELNFSNMMKAKDTYSNYCDFEENTWLVNMSMFQEIKELKSIDLSYNGVAESFKNEELGNLENLETLDLSYNDLETSTRDIKSFSKLSKLKLKHLDLSLNDFNDDILHFLNIISSLESLDLSENHLEWPQFDQGLGKLNNLTVLKISDNYRLNGSTLRIESLCGLKILEELDLSSNYFRGSIPDCLGNLTSLRILNLSRNKFTGQITCSWLSSLSFLQDIDFRDNLFEGPFSFKEFGNHSSLEVVQFKSNINKFKIVTEYPGWVPPFQLQVLVLQNCSLDAVPEFLYHQSKLKMVDLSGNRINSSFPNWMCKNNTGLEYISLRNNCFVGQIHDLPTNLSWLDFSNNCFGGQFTEIRGKTILVPNMKFLNLSRNNFQGDFPFSLGEDCKLISLDLSSNNFTGEVPEELVSNCSSLVILKLSHNNFHGRIFPNQLNLTRLWTLELNDNHFTGNLGGLITKADRLSVLDVSNNRFHGQIPRWIRNQTRLYYIIMQNNFLKGQISCELFSSDYIDLSYNTLSGSLPSCLNQSLDPFLDFLGNPLHLNLQGNMFSGSIPEAFLDSSSLLTLDLRDNNLSGSIPNRFGEFSSLRILALAGNHLNGDIPDWLCQVKGISLLDLSRNSFSGSIPNCLSNLFFASEGPNDPYIFEIGASITLDGFYSGDFMGRADDTSGYTFALKVKEEFEFVTKHRGNKYTGGILNYMSGLDLSQNNLIGEIPYELGNLSQIRALNLSHNRLMGSIPKSFSNLSLLESLDLSYNTLSGEIPLELIDLHFLAVFTVAHNNLSGRIPDLKGQFSTFECSSYEGNPFLRGPPLDDCGGRNKSAPSPILLPPESEEKWYETDEVVFLTSFSVSFAMFFIGVITLLYVNPYWRQRLFYYSQEFMFSCYYFLCDNLFKYFIHLCC